jgi:hypothetical protein
MAPATLRPTPVPAQAPAGQPRAGSSSFQLQVEPADVRPPGKVQVEPVNLPRFPLGGDPLVLPYLLVVWVLLYLDLRARKERLHLDTVRAGLEGPEA